MKDYYEILGISKNASQDEVKKAFHRLAHKHHPNKGGDESKFKEINEAYQTLSNQEKRKQYDMFGNADGAGNFNWAWGKEGTQNIEFDMEDLNDMFGDVFGFGSRASRKKDLKRGKDIRVDIEVSLEEVLKDINKNISLRMNVRCSRCEGKGAEPGTALNECFSCRGTGEVQKVKRTFLGSFTQWSICPECDGEGQRPQKPCNVCKGEGQVKGEEDISINIPAGVDSHQMIKMVGRGEAGKKGGQSGDLYVRILVKEHELFKRRGDDLITSRLITFSQSVLGDKIKLVDLEGSEFLQKIPARTESGKIIKINGKGIPHFSGYGRGDLYIELKIETPKHLTKEQKMLLKELQKQGL
ncbi:molecular chaperone DnaJ [Patescibacteria group bacterium]|nr:molecular chaperone DnaJ [Patescibacteria group bacterium]